MHREYALSVDLAYTNIVEDLWWLNPLKWAERVFFYMTGHYIEDTLDENPDNEQMYIPNILQKNAYEYIYPYTDPYT